MQCEVIENGEYYVMRSNRNIVILGMAVSSGIYIYVLQTTLGDMMNILAVKNDKQECIPVGYVPPAC